MIRYLLFIMVFPFLAACGANQGSGFAELSSLEQHMFQNGLKLPHLVYKKEFDEICEFYVVTHVDNYLEGNGIEIQGPEGGEYMYGKDLLALCGPECNSDSGLGIILNHLLVNR